MKTYNYTTVLFVGLFFLAVVSVGVKGANNIANTTHVFLTSSNSQTNWSIAVKSANVTMRGTNLTLQWEWHNGTKINLLRNAKWGKQTSGSNATHSWANITTDVKLANGLNWCNLTIQYYALPRDILITRIMNISDANITSYNPYCENIYARPRLRNAMNFCTISYHASDDLIKKRCFNDTTDDGHLYGSGTFDSEGNHITYIPFLDIYHKTIAGNTLNLLFGVLPYQLNQTLFIRWTTATNDAIYFHSVNTNLTNTNGVYKRLRTSDYFVLVNNSKAIYFDRFTKIKNSTYGINYIRSDLDSSFILGLNNATISSLSSYGFNALITNPIRSGSKLGDFDWNVSQMNITINLLHSNGWKIFPYINIYEVDINSNYAKSHSTFTKLTKAGANITGFTSSYRLAGFGDPNWRNYTANHIFNKTKWFNIDGIFFDNWQIGTQRVDFRNTTNSKIRDLSHHIGFQVLYQRIYRNLTTYQPNILIIGNTVQVPQSMYTHIGTLDIRNNIISGFNGSKTIFDDWNDLQSYLPHNFTYSLVGLESSDSSNRNQILNIISKGFINRLYNNLQVYFGLSSVNTTSLVTYKLPLYYGLFNRTNITSSVRSFNGTSNQNSFGVNQSITILSSDKYLLLFGRSNRTLTLPVGYSVWSYNKRDLTNRLRYNLDSRGDVLIIITTGNLSFNVQEGRNFSRLFGYQSKVVEDYVPVHFTSSSTSTLKKIASNLSQPINATVVFSGSYSNVKDIVFINNNSRDYSPDTWTLNSNGILSADLYNIAPGTNSVYIEGSSGGGSGSSGFKYLPFGFGDLFADDIPITLGSKTFNLPVWVIGIAIILIVIFIMAMFNLLTISLPVILFLIIIFIVIVIFTRGSIS